MPGCDVGPSVKSWPFVIFKNKQKPNQQPQQKLLLVEIEIVMNNSQMVKESQSVGLAAPGAGSIQLWARSRYSPATAVT